MSKPKAPLGVLVHENLDSLAVASQLFNICFCCLTLIELGYMIVFPIGNEIVYLTF